MKFKKGIHPNQEVLFPKKIADYLPDDHKAKVIKEVIKILDLSSIENKYSEQGQHAYNPKNILGLLFYGYSVGLRSSREISIACEERLDFAFLVDGLKPSHDRISDFRKENLEEIKKLFGEIVLIGANLGLVKSDDINASIDGTKIKANASAKLSKDEKGLNRLLLKVEEDIKKILKEAKKIDKKENKKYGKKRGDELPKKLRGKESRKRAIEEAMQKLKEQKEKKKEEIRNEKGRELKERELEKIEKMKINVTDNEAKFMKERQGVIRPSYNAQLSVDEKEQFILANDVVDECNDQHQLVPMVQKTRREMKENPKKVKTDNGYKSQLEIASEQFPEIEFYIDDKNRRKSEIDWKKIKKKYSDVELKNLKRLLTARGEKEYRKRMYTVEPVFGNLKYNLGQTEFLMRGLKKAKGEFNLMCIGHNLGKITRFIQRKKIKLALEKKLTRTILGLYFGLSLKLYYNLLSKRLSKSCIE
jgi:transposase